MRELIVEVSKDGVSVVFSPDVPVAKFEGSLPRAIAEVGAYIGLKIAGVLVLANLVIQQVVQPNANEDPMVRIATIGVGTIGTAILAISAMEDKHIVDALISKAESKS